MPFYLLKQMSGLVVVLLVMSFFVFCLQSIIPDDPARAVAGPTAPAATVELVREQLGLDDPIMVQYGRFLMRLAQGDLGTSFRTRQPITADVGKYLPATLELMIVSVVLGVALAAGLALLQVLFPKSSLVRVAIIGVGSTPIFLCALLLVYFFWFNLHWLPGSGRLGRPGFAGPTGFNLIDGFLVGQPAVSLDAFAHILLPSLALALPIAVAVGRTMSSALHDVMQQAYIRTARGKGISETRLVLRHGLRNAATAPLAMVGLQVRLLFGNLLVVERIFGWPGLGQYMVHSLASSDLPAILGVSMVFGTIYILVNIAVEICQSLADPRIAP
ncbi:ABC transporter permease [Pararhizobium sp. BT-229]|uniref:ABC transporter permease n=1 Tax=Pararhizobium sp. BT-229 TaxID=2986923 RepID=UPI0021F7F537|nr:ABC transporter permease [Pararhizobium sp. BT-229]MCV9966749.1 ABC transporter permease [Pararhizobium sp. BT-229]